MPKVTQLLGARTGIHTRVRLQNLGFSPAWVPPPSSLRSRREPQFTQRGYWSLPGLLEASLRKCP